MPKENKKNFCVVAVDRDRFELRDGRQFRHLFEWSYDPELEDFENLFSLYSELMTGPHLLIKSG
jgi:hypothetical protein